MPGSLRSLPLLGLLLGSLGCTGEPPAPPVLATGDYAGLIRYLNHYIPRQMAEHRVPGLSVALVDGQQLIWAQGFGYADQGHGVPVSTNTAFRAGPISQLLTASAALQLVDQGRLQLDRPLQDSLRGFYVRSRFHAEQQDADRAITLRRLLSHQSGLPGDYLRGQYTAEGLARLPARITGLWLNNPPGSQVAYSNLGYALTGAAIEHAAQRDFESHLQASLLRPLGMDRSSFIGNSQHVGNRSQGYRDGQPSVDPEVRDLSATGLWSNPRDLSHYLQMLFAGGRYQGRQLLSAQAVGEMFRPQNLGNPLDFDCLVGLGWFLSPCGEEPAVPGIRTWQHTGAGEDFYTQVTVLPEQQLAVIVMSNADSGADLVPPLVARTLRLMLQAHGARTPCLASGEPPPARLGHRRIPAAADRQHLAGHYATAWGVLRIRDDDRRLYGELSGQRFELLRDEQGWLRARSRRFGFWPQDLGRLGRVQLDVMSVQGHHMLVLKSHGQRLALGERIEPVPLTDSWQDMVGDYQLLEDDPLAPLNAIKIVLEDGFLLARGQLEDRTEIDYILTPVDNAHAIIAGNGSGLGDTVSRQVNGLGALGYHFKRTDPFHNLLGF